MKSPFRYPGSKARALKFIKPFLNELHYDEYREPFVGGGAIFFALPKVKHTWINDIDKDLITTYQIIASPNQRQLLIQKLANEVATKERHEQMKKWQPKIAEDIAYRYYYLNRTSYSGIMNKPAWGYHIKKSVPPERWQFRIKTAGDILEGVKITCLDYHDIFKAPLEGKSGFFFVDPPYFEADQKRAYAYSFNLNDHKELCRLLKEFKHPFCLTYDDCERIRDLYSWANIYPVTWRYQTANAKKTNRKMGNELIITNF